jgi:predicted  nucleic acid-binding Zn-ribbon protein
MQQVNQDKPASFAQPYADTLTTLVDALVKDSSELLKERQRLDYRRQQLLEKRQALSFQLEQCTEKLYSLQEQVGNAIEDLHQWNSQHAVESPSH